MADTTPGGEPRLLRLAVAMARNEDVVKPVAAQFIALTAPDIWLPSQKRNELRGYKTGLITTNQELATEN
jgi:hypothetical protein